jgi:hypothetical protein
MGGDLMVDEENVKMLIRKKIIKVLGASPIK